MPDSNQQPTTAFVRIQRFNPDNDKKPYIQEFKVPLTADTTILDALHYIKAEIDGSLTFGSVRGIFFCASVTAVSASWRTVASTVDRVCRHTSLARVNETSRPSPTMRMAFDSTAVPSFTSVRSTLPDSACAHSRETTAAPKLASQT